MKCNFLPLTMMRCFMVSFRFRFYQLQYEHFWEPHVFQLFGLLIWNSLLFTFELLNVNCQHCRQKFFWFLQAFEGKKRYLSQKSQISIQQSDTSPVRWLIYNYNSRNILLVECTGVLLDNVFEIAHVMLNEICRCYLIRLMINMKGDWVRLISIMLNWVICFK